MEGWISLYRKSFGNFLYQEKRPHTRREAWEDILLLVNHRPGKVLVHGELIDCGIGQSVMSIQSWAKQFRWSRQQVRSFFNLLESEKMITTKGLHKTTILTVCNYETYQELQPTDNQQITNKKPTDNQQITTNNNDNNDNNENNENKKKNPPLSPQGENLVAGDFEKNPAKGKPIQKKTVEKKSVDLSKFNYPFSSEKFIKTWEEWMKMKKQTKKEFSAHEKNLKRLGQYDEDFATWLVENAIAGDYQGCIFPDTATVYAKWLKNKQDGGENFNKKMSFTDFQNMPTDGKPVF